MNNAIVITLSAQNVLQRRLEVVANNMANVSTAGFKSEELLFQPTHPSPASIKEKPRTVDFVRDFTIARNMTQGSLETTGNNFDFAITGSGYFTIQTATGPAYTRDGRFTLNSAGTIVTRDGRPVLDDGGNPITVDVRRGAIKSDEQGNITQNGRRLGKLGVANFARPGTLVGAGDNLLRATSQAPTPAENFTINQGMVETSNVNAIKELTDIMQISRAFESATKLQKQAEDLQQNAINRLGRVA